MREKETNSLYLTKGIVQALKAKGISASDEVDKFLNSLLLIGNAKLLDLKKELEEKKKELMILEQMINSIESLEQKEQIVKQSGELSEAIDWLKALYFAKDGGMIGAENFRKAFAKIKGVYDLDSRELMDLIEKKKAVKKDGRIQHN